MASLQLKRTLSGDTVSGLQSYDMAVEVVSATGIPPEIFIFERQVGDTDTVDKFMRVANLVELEDLPTEPPTINTPKCLFRASEITLRILSQEEVAEIWEYLQLDSIALVEAANTDLKGPQTIDISLGG